MIDEYTRKATLKRVIDGDTVDLVIDLGWGITFNERVRLLDIDTPELRGEEREEGLKYKEFVREWFDAQPFVWLHSHKYKLGKYGRTLGDVYSYDSSVCLNTILADKLTEESLPKFELEYEELDRGVSS